MTLPVAARRYRKLYPYLLVRIMEFLTQRLRSRAPPFCQLVTPDGYVRLPQKFLMEFIVYGVPMAAPFS